MEETTPLVMRSPAGRLIEGREHDGLWSMHGLDFKIDALEREGWSRASD